MKGRIVVVADVDSEVRRVLDHLPPDDVVIVESDQLRRGQLLEWRLDAGGPPAGPGGVLLGPEPPRSVFYRPPIRYDDTGEPKPGILDVDGMVPAAFAEFSALEATATLTGGLLGGSTNWMNHPGRVYRAEHKLSQLAAARRIGLDVPRTLVSNDPERLISFWHDCAGSVVTKSVSSYSHGALINRVPSATQLVTRSDLPDLLEMPRIPTLLQEFVPAAVDLRVTVVGRRLFTTAIHSQSGSSPLDWRFDYTVPMTPAELPNPVADGLLTLVAGLGLAYGAADFRLTPDGRHVFLEINSFGVFEFVEELTGAEISKAIADWLARPGPDD